MCIIIYLIYLMSQYAVLLLDLVSGLFQTKPRKWFIRILKRRFFVNIVLYALCTSMHGYYWQRVVNCTLYSVIILELLYLSS